jgi:hypothetical protein
MLRTALLMASFATATACAVGPRAASEPLAQNPRGAHVTLRTDRAVLDGELLEVQDTALLVLGPAERLTIVPYRVIRSGEAELVGAITRGGRTPPPARRARLSLVSRFPQGLDADLLTALLRAYRQTEPEVLR